MQQLTVIISTNMKNLKGMLCPFALIPLVVLLEELTIFAYTGFMAGSVYQRLIILGRDTFLGQICVAKTLLFQDQNHHIIDS